MMTRSLSKVPRRKKDISEARTEPVLPVDRILDRLQKTAACAKRASWGSACELREVIPTGIEALDSYVFGSCGGIPVARIGEIFGDEGSCKTSLGFQILGATQRLGGVAAFIETERTLIAERGIVFGVSLEDLILSEPATTEDVLDAIRDILAAIPKGIGPNAIVWDSIAATELAGQSGKAFGKSSIVRKKGKLFSDALPILSRMLAGRRTALVFINQIRDKIGVMFGDKSTTPGGHAPKFHSSWRFQLWRGANVKQGGAVVGLTSTIKLVKSKVCLPFRKARIRLLFDSGWDNAHSLLVLGRELKIVSSDAEASPETLDVIRAALRDLPKPTGKIIDGAVRGEETSPDPVREPVLALVPAADPYDGDVDLSGTPFAIDS